MLELLDEIKSRSDTVTDEDGNELKKKRREKTIIFSQFTSMLDLMEPFLQEEGIDYVRCTLYT
jgi:SNF2 family DNA or RNA helicase